MMVFKDANSKKSWDVNEYQNAVMNLMNLYFAQSGTQKMNDIFKLRICNIFKFQV